MKNNIDQKLEDISNGEAEKDYKAYRKIVEKDGYVCPNCDTHNEWKGYSYANKYCNNKCQQEYQNRQKLNEWLETGDKLPKNIVKNYILEEQDHCCNICKMKDEWNGKPIVFILDHINGNADNNKRENLRLVCPNCDSQLSTFANRNRGNGRWARRQRYNEGKSS